MTISVQKLAACKTDDERLLVGLEALREELSASASIDAIKRDVDEAMARHEEAMRDRFPQFSMRDAGRHKFITAGDPPEPPRRSWTCAYCERHVSIGPERTKCPNCGAAEEHAPSRAGRWIVLPRGTNSTGPR